MFPKTRLLLIPWLLVLVAAASDHSHDLVLLQQEVIRERLQQYVKDNPAREIVLKRLFEDAGCRGGCLEEQQVPKAAAPNVICTLPGESDEKIIVGAHFDHVDAGDGVVDNWSGASLLPSLYQSLNARPRRHTFVFISFTDEEKGFIGSRYYSEHLAAGGAARIRAMVDMDTLGLGPTEIWASNSDTGLVKLMYDVASAMRLPVGVMNVDEYGDSDGKFFKRLDIPIITLHSVTRGTLHVLHTKDDNAAAIRFDDYFNSYKLIAGFLAELDAAPVPAGIPPSTPVQEKGVEPYLNPPLQAQ
jgi:hypothetical protein